MVKILRSYTIDAELVEKLSIEGNASGLINSLLHNYFGKGKEELKTEEKGLKNRLKMVKNDQKMIEKAEKEAKNAQDLQKKKQEIKEKHRKEFEDDREKLAEKVKNKEISFEEFRRLATKLKESYGF